MENLKRLETIASLCNEKTRIFDLFGTGAISLEEVDSLRTGRAKFLAKENDLELFVRDFWESIVHYERQSSAAGS